MTLTGKVHRTSRASARCCRKSSTCPSHVPTTASQPQQSLAAIEQLFKSDIDPTRVAAIIIEPVQGEGGFYIAPPEFLRSLRALCDTHGIVLIADEIQSGFARTGRMFAFEHAGVEPDLMTVAKSIAGGVPLSGVVGKAEIMDAPPAGRTRRHLCRLAARLCGRAGRAGRHGGGAALERARSSATLIMTRLKAMQAKSPAIGEVRGLGAMVAIELVKNGSADQPDADLTRALVQAAARHGLIILSCGVYANVIRFLAPLTISDALLDEGLDVLEARWPMSARAADAPPTG